MSHKTVYMGISANKLKGDVCLENISAYVEKTMKKYVEAMGGKLRIDVELPTGKHIGFTV